MGWLKNITLILTVPWAGSAKGTGGTVKFVNSHSIGNYLSILVNITIKNLNLYKHIYC
jgi:hypothetical protein